MAASTDNTVKDRFIVGIASMGGSSLGVEVRLASVENLRGAEKHNKFSATIKKTDSPRTFNHDD